MQVLERTAKSIIRATSKVAALLLRGLVRAYQLVIAPLLGHNCRYLPGCSAYALEALERHGPGKGSWLAAKRICRCHPWGGHGYDPVPTAEAEPRHAMPQARGATSKG